MKKIVILALLLAIFCSLFSGSVLAQDIVDTSAAMGCHSLQASIALGGMDKKLDTATAAILYELNTDTLVYSWNADARLDPTGMVKFMTALIALEQGDLTDQVTVTRSALDTVALGAVSAQLQVGEVLTLRDLLYCVMVSSANDAAAVIAEHIGGSQEGFAQLMNDKAAALGCVNTHFVNPHGLSAQDQYSTARELAIITEAALENPKFNTMFCAKDHVIPATNKSEMRKLTTTNYMMSTASSKKYLDERVTGGKPAAASTTDRSMICTAQVDSSRYLCVVMSTEAVVEGNSVIRYGCFEETSALLDYGFENFSVRQVVDVDQIFSQVPVTGGENHVVLQPAQDVFTVLPVDYLPENLFLVDSLDHSALVAPMEKGDVLGRVQITYGTVVVGSCDLVAMFDVAKEGTTIQPAEPPEPDEQQPLVDPMFFHWIGIVIVAAAVLALVVFLGMKLLRSAKIRRMYRRRRRERRRSR